MRFRFKRPGLLDKLVKILAFVLTGGRFCKRRNLYSVLGIVLITVFVWWTIGNRDTCNGHEIKKQVCKEYRGNYVTGNLCHDYCYSDELDMGSCYSDQNDLKSFSNWELLFKVSSDPLSGRLAQARIEEGLSFEQFTQGVHELLGNELGLKETSSLLHQLVSDFDVNKDGGLNLGEAENLWRLLKQPDFLNFYIFQDSTSVPYLNGTCGGISVWHQVHKTKGDVLYNKETPWPLSLFTNHAYRWMLPSWTRRAKVMLSLVELMEDLFEKDGVRYHLCNVDGLTLYQLNSYEVIITEETMLLSSQQIKNRLSNIICHHSHDCILTPQCQTTCDVWTKKCTGVVTRPTITLACDIMEDYLLFDAPQALKPSLTRLIHRCQNLSQHLQKGDLIHSVVIVDLKSVLWNYIQYKLK